MPKRSKNPRSTNYIVKKTAEEYATSSSAHGISYISEHERLCLGGLVQTEQHVVEECVFSEHERTFL